MGEWDILGPFSSIFGIQTLRFLQTKVAAFCWAGTRQGYVVNLLSGGQQWSPGQPFWTRWPLLIQVLHDRYFFSQPGHMSAIYIHLSRNMKTRRGSKWRFPKIYGYPKPVVSRSNMFQGCCAKPMTCRSPCPSQRGQQLTLMSAKPGLDCRDQKTHGLQTPNG